MTYNINADTESGTGQIGDPDGGTGLPAVMEALGAIHLGDGNAQPVDIFALEELHYDNPSVSSTLQYLVAQLNSYYGAGTYAYDTYVDPTDGNSTGNGPSGLIYNTHTVMVLSETNLAYGTSGAARAPMRYYLQPVGGSSSSAVLSLRQPYCCPPARTRRPSKSPRSAMIRPPWRHRRMSSIRATSTPLQRVGLSWL